MSETDPRPVSEFLRSNHILVDDLRAAWRYAIRALNYCENGELTDTRKAMCEIVCKLSQQLEFHETVPLGK